jgi:lipoprotein-releasing system permease protein
VPSYEWLLIRRYALLPSGDGIIRLVAALSFLGIALGVATLIVVMSVMNGYRSELINKFLGLDGHVTVKHYDGGPIMNFQHIAEDLGSHKEVVSVQPVVEGQVMLSYEGVSTGTLVRGLTLADVQRRPLLAKNLRPADISRFKDGGVLIGEGMARRFGIGLGSVINLLSSSGSVTAFGTMPTSLSYPVAGFFKTGLYDMDQRVVVMPLGVAQSYFGLTSNMAKMLEIDLKDASNAMTTRKELDSVLGGAYSIRDWTQTHKSLMEALALESRVMFLILSLIIIIATFNVISGLQMFVKTKVRDVGILRSMGMTRRGIMRLFMCAGMGLSLAGTLVGVFLGSMIALNIESIRAFIEHLTGAQVFREDVYFLSHLPSQLLWQDVVSILCLSLGVGLLATLWPSIKAARLQPVEALRYD